VRDRLVKVLYGAASIRHFLAELNELSNLGKGPETMKVPYAKKWHKETTSSQTRDERGQA
jgi:hypothetical protein